MLKAKMTKRNMAAVCFIFALAKYFN